MKKLTLCMTLAAFAMLPTLQAGEGCCPSKAANKEAAPSCCPFSGKAGTTCPKAAAAAKEKAAKATTVSTAKGSGASKLTQKQPL